MIYPRLPGRASIAIKSVLINRADEPLEDLFPVLPRPPLAGARASISSIKMTCGMDRGRKYFGTICLFFVLVVF